MKKLLPILLIAVLAAGGLYWWFDQRGNGGDGLILYGNVDIRQVALAFDGSGRITELLAEEGDVVSKGDVIGRLDTEPLELQAKAQEAAVEAQRQNLFELRDGPRPEEIAQARAKVVSDEAAAKLANIHRERVVRLITGSSSAVSQSDMDRAVAEADAANAMVDQSKAALDLLLAGTRPEGIAAAEAQLRGAEAQLEHLRYQISQGELTTPSDAIVRSRLREPGDIVTSQLPVFALAISQPKWIRVYVREADLGRIKPGMAAQVTTDSYPDTPVAGTVGYISSVAEFTPKAVQTEELRTSLVYEVRIIVEDAEGNLRLGQPVTVRLPVEPVS